MRKMGFLLPALVPYAAMGEALSIHYSGDSELPRDVAKWLKTNGIG